MLGFRCHPLLLLPLLLIFFRVSTTSASRPSPYAMRLSCGAQNDVHTQPTNTLWRKDFGYTGGFPANSTIQTFLASIAPPLSTVRHFPSSEGADNCYIINHVPEGHYSVRIFYGSADGPDFHAEPLFDISIEGTLVESLESGWSILDAERVFTEVLVYLTDGRASICFHNTGRGDPTILAIELLQIDVKAYHFSSKLGEQVILKTVRRMSCGERKPKFDVDYGGDPWGGDRYWNPVITFGLGNGHVISTGGDINNALEAPNFYPESLYKTALVSIHTGVDLSYTMHVEPNANYSIWLHFAEIDFSITGAGDRVFDIMVNGDYVFKEIDVLKMSGGHNTALVLNTSVVVNGRSLTISLLPARGSRAIINAIEVFQVIRAEAKTFPDEIDSLQSLKKALQLPSRLGWNGDPCVPQQHPWNGIDCLFDSEKHKWFINGIVLDNQRLEGSLPNDILRLNHLQNINMSGNNIHGAIPSSMGSLKNLETLDLSYNTLNGSVPESLGQLGSLRVLNLNGNKLTGRVPSALGALLMHRSSFNFSGNNGLCGIPGLPACGRLSVGAKIGVAFATFIGLLVVAVCGVIWWKRRQNILKSRRAAREAPYAKRRTHFSQDVQMMMHSHTAAENGESLMS